MSTEDGSTGRRFVAGAALAIGCLIVALALPRTAAYGMLALDGGQAGAALDAGRVLPPEVLAGGRGRYASALAVLPSDGDIATDLARLDLRAAALDDAAVHFAHAARHTPNNTFVWSRLARTAQLRGEAPEAVAGYLRLSRLTGRFEASSLLMRPQAALAYWDKLPAETKEDAIRDLRRLAGETRLRRDMIRMYISLGYRERAILLGEAFDKDGDRVRFQRQVLSRAGESPATPVRRP